LLWNVNKKS